MTRRDIDKEALERAAERAARDSAHLEGRDVPDDFERSPSIERFLKDLRRRETVERIVFDGDRSETP